MRLTPFFFLAIILPLSFGCAAKKQHDLNQDVHNANANVAIANLKHSAAADFAKSEAFTLIKPADGPIQSAYGMRKHPTKKRQKFHHGIDIAAKRGSTVVAAASGTVTFSGRKNGYGKVVEIDHGNGKQTLYAHMDSVFVVTGQKLAQAEPLGTVGRTGRTTGPNLHFELLADGKTTNPVPKEGWAQTAPEALFAGQSKVPASAGDTTATLVAAASASGKNTPQNEQAPLITAKAKPASKKRGAAKKTSPSSTSIHAAKKTTKRPAS